MLSFTLHKFFTFRHPPSKISTLLVKQTYYCYKKEAELNKFAAAYPDIVLDEEIDKLHFQDASMKQVMKDLVA